MKLMNHKKNRVIANSRHYGRSRIMSAGRMVNGRPTELIPQYSARSIRASVMHSVDPFALIEDSSYDYIREWDNSNYCPNRKTSWDHIFDNVLDEFMRYADDEASDFLLDQFRNREIDQEEMLYMFDNWVSFVDLNDFDF